MEESKDKVYWLVGSEEMKPYDTSTWYRCMKIEEFVKKVEENNTIVGIIFSDNNLGFVLEPKSGDNPVDSGEKQKER